jgi:hypothetical protein
MTYYSATFCNVGVNTSNPMFPLDVNGTIATNALVVNGALDPSDYQAGGTYMVWDCNDTGASFYMNSSSNPVGGHSWGQLWESNVYVELMSLGRENTMFYPSCNLNYGWCLDVNGDVQARDDLFVGGDILNCQDKAYDKTDPEVTKIGYKYIADPVFLGESNLVKAGNIQITAQDLVGGFKGAEIILNGATENYDGALDMYTANKRRMRIGSDGQVAIGDIMPDWKLDVDGPIRGMALVVDGTCRPDKGAAFIMWNKTGNNGFNNYLNNPDGRDGGHSWGQIANDGTVDERMRLSKDNKTPMASNLIPTWSLYVEGFIMAKNSMYTQNVYNDMDTATSNDDVMTVGYINEAKSVGGGNNSGGSVRINAQDIKDGNKGGVIYVHGGTDNYDGSIEMFTANQQRVRIGSDGQVGIGVNLPDWKLDVDGAVRAVGFVSDGACKIKQGGAYMMWNKSDNKGFSHYLNEESNLSDGGHSWGQVNTSGVETEHMRLGKDNKYYPNTATNTSWSLFVGGDIMAQDKVFGTSFVNNTDKAGSTNAPLEIKFRTNATATGSAYARAGDVEITAQTMNNGGKGAQVILRGGDSNANDGDIRFLTNATERMRIADNGDVGIGTTPSHFLDCVKNDCAKPAGGSWVASSDSRLKEDIVLADLQACYDNVKAIPLKYYKWRDDIYTDDQVPDRHMLGWVAQDVETVFPKAVFKRAKFGYDDCRSLDSDQIIASMYGALQKVIQDSEKQKLKLDIQESIIQNLLIRLNALESSK